jgi:outer membrane protein assembly factor BamA
MVATQRNLYDLGIFARVEQAIQNPNGIEETKYLLHQFEEARRYSVNFGFGAQIARIGGGNYTDFENPSGSTGFSPRISFGVTRVNMFGVAHTASLQARISDTRQRALLSYLAPQVKSRDDLDLTFTALYDFSRDINTFESARLEGSVQLAQRLSRANTVRYRVAYRRVDTGNIRISPDLIPVFAQPVRVGLAALDLMQDRRDDPLNSTRGYYNALETSVASRYIGSQTNYFRMVGRNSSYHRLGRDVVLARSFTFGWLANLTGEDNETLIPLPERIFSGGASSHRGFPDNQAGPRDLETGFPLGGRGLFMHNLELRFPLVGDNIGGVLFHDAGNVYSSVSDISFRFRQRDRQDFDYMVHSFGFGIRYSTPIGPIRLDLSYSPNSPRFYGFEGTLEELIKGEGKQINQRINQFQFFFSIGQTF